MSTDGDPIALTAPVQHDQMDTSPPLLSYGCTPWRISSQHMADLYNSGTRFWTKSDLRDIEQQLERSATLDRFTLRCVDGSQVQVKNPHFGVQAPIWKPFVRYQEYWRLVVGAFDGPPGTHYCSYLIDWKNHADSDFRGNVEGWEAIYQTRKQLWNQSGSYASFKLQLWELLASHRVTKIVCLGLGDIARKPPPNTVLPGQEYKSQEPADLHTKELYPGMLQHAAALTIAEETARLQCRPVSVISQDPQYTDDTKALLKAEGFEIMGDFGAGGFSEVDDETIVFSAWTNAPVKQIVADIARPAAIITCNDDGIVMNHFGKPYGDPDSPRARQMLRGYERRAFPTDAAEVEMMEGLEGLEILARTGKNL